MRITCIKMILMLLDIIESHILKNRGDFEKNVNLTFEKTSPFNYSLPYPCCFCAKVLSRILQKVSKLLLPKIFSEILQKCVKKLLILQNFAVTFCNFRMTSITDDLPAYNLITPLVESFNEDVNPLSARSTKW